MKHETIVKKEHEIRLNNHDLIQLLNDSAQLKIPTSAEVRISNRHGGPEIEIDDSDPVVISWIEYGDR